MVNISINDPDKDSYFHFYSDAFEIESAEPGQIIYMEYFKIPYPGAGPDDIEIISNVVLKAWQIGSNVYPATDAIMVPSNCAGKTLCVLLEIDGIPYSKSIPINHGIAEINPV